MGGKGFVSIDTNDPVADLEFLIEHAESAEELKAHALKAVKNWAFARCGLDDLNADLDEVIELLGQCVEVFDEEDLAETCAGDRADLKQRIEDWLGV